MVLSIRNSYWLIVFLSIIYQKMQLILLYKMIINDLYLLQTEDESEWHQFMTYMRFLVFVEKNSFNAMHRCLL